MCTCTCDGVTQPAHALRAHMPHIYLDTRTRIISAPRQRLSAYSCKRNAWHVARASLPSAVGPAIASLVACHLVQRHARMRRASCHRPLGSATAHTHTHAPTRPPCVSRSPRPPMVESRRPRLEPRRSAGARRPRARRAAARFAILRGHPPEVAPPGHAARVASIWQPDHAG